MPSSRRAISILLLVLSASIAYYLWREADFQPKYNLFPESQNAAQRPSSESLPNEADKVPHDPVSLPSDTVSSSFRWSQVPQHYPVSSFSPLPSGVSRSLPRIQYNFGKESAKSRSVRQARLSAVLGNFTESWNGYKNHAWLKDEVGPLSGQSYDHFGGWAASLVDGLDTLWIMGLTDAFEEAVDAVKQIDFSTCALQELNVFETVIRYMGGLLGAYDLSHGTYPVLLYKATELGEMVFKAFDTPNRMPITRWDFQSAKLGIKQKAPDNALVAEIGSISLELIRLSQLTGDNKYYDAIKRITDQLETQQKHTQLPGLFPVVVNPRELDFKTGNLFTLGGMVDSLYEYLPKAHLLLNGAVDQYEKLYLNALRPIQENIIYKPMTIDDRDIRIAGQVTSDSNTIRAEPQMQHLTCFAGGMVALGSRISQDTELLRLGRQLTDGCIWGYEIMPRGILPEIIHTTRCASVAECQWDESAWHSSVDSMTPGDDHVADKIKSHNLPKGVGAIDDTRYGLRPEAIESVFVLYRLTGDAGLLETAWRMFNAIVTATKTDLGAAALDDCVDPDRDHRTDRMESFWLAETLKYFYLIFSEPNVVSLDEFVLNTEAHPFRYRTWK